MNIVIIYCMFSILLWICVISYTRKKSKDNLHPIIIFLLFYILNYPIKMIATKCGIYLINSNKIGDNMQLLAMLLSDIYTLCIVVAFVKKPSLKININERLWRGPYDYNNAAAFFVGLFIISGWIVYGRGSIIRMFSISAMMKYRSLRTVERFGSGVNSLFESIMTICLFAFIYIGMCSIYKSSLKKKICFISVVFVLTWYAYAQSLSKTTILLTPLSLIICYQLCCIRDGHNGISLRLIGTAGSLGLLAVAWMELIDVMAVRAVTGTRTKAMLISFFNPSFDAPDNLTAIIDRVDNIWFGQLSLKPFFYNLFLSKIPRGIWPSKSPINGKIMIVKELLPEFFVSYANYNSASPSIAGDAIASGGILLGIFLTGIYGIIFYNLYKSVKISDNLISNVMYVFFIANLNNFCRGGSDLIGNMIYYYLITCFICIMYRFFSIVRIRCRNQYK